MFRTFHGEILPLETEAPAGNDAHNLGVEANPPNDGPGMLLSSPHWPFDYLFPKLQFDPLNLLLRSEETVENLKALGRSMLDRPVMATPGVPVPTAYTFFGQFVAHDITFEEASDKVRNLSANPLEPLSVDDVRRQIVNTRSPNLDLDSVYGPEVPRDPTNNDKLLLGIVSHSRGLPHGKDIYNDLPRGPRNQIDITQDRKALIGDKRNDENLVLAQLHVAFMRAHNALIDRGYKFKEARKLIRQHYQWVVLNDFLERVADPAIVNKVRYEGPKFFPLPKPFFIPLEFAVAAFRFGHSKVREVYLDYSDKQTQADLGQLFTFTALSGDNAYLDTLPDDWVIDWTNFLNSQHEKYFSRPIDTMLVDPLHYLTHHGGHAMEVERNLAIRNLLRGYILSLPTGQAVARAMGSQGIKPLEVEQIASVAANDEQRNLLKSPIFLDRTPLWFYILAEAAYYNRGYHLGPVGSTIVAEVIIGVLRQSDNSILKDPSWTPTLGSTPHKFDLSDLFKLAGVL